MRLPIIIISLIFFTSSICEVKAQHIQVPDTLAKPAPLYKQDTLTICIIGDIMMHTRQIEKAYINDSTYDFNSYFSLIEEHLKSADIAIANMEFTLAGKPYTGYPCFSAPDCFAEYIAASGIDVLLGANNHIFDKKSRGAERTIEQIKALSPKYNIRLCGISSDSTDFRGSTPLKIRMKGMSVAIINFTYGTNLGADKKWPKVNYMGEKSMILKALEEAEKSDFTLVTPHWGEEYELLPSEQQRKTALWLAENGADAIIGTHPHVPQTFEYISEHNKPVAYSLGNAVSNMSAANTQLELMVSIQIVRHWNGDIDILPLQFTYLWCSSPGGFGKSYTVIPVKDYLDKKELWNGIWDYEKMVKTYYRVKEKIRIND